MDDAIRRLRSHARHLTRGTALQGIRYPAPFRAAAVQLARAQVARGAPVARVARTLGLPGRSLARWLERPPAPVLRPVAMAPEPVLAPRAGLVVITPQGLRVEGLDGETLVALLRALG
jgi:hypothetical protein